MSESSPLKSKNNAFKKGSEPDEKKSIPTITKEDEPLRSSIKFVESDKPVPKVIDEPKKSAGKLEVTAPAEKKEA